MLLRRDAAVSYHIWPRGTRVADVVEMKLAGGGGLVEMTGGKPLPSVTRYYRGNNPALWHAAIPQYGTVALRNVYQGIDMLWRAQEPRLEYDFFVRAGADPGRIQLRFRGAHGVTIDRRGNLMIDTRAGRLCHHKPVAWQEINGKRVGVAAKFRLDHDGAGFELGRYDRSRPLWIDPALSYSTTLGGDGYDAGFAVASDGAGHVYVTGATDSLSFTAGTGRRFDIDAFVTKFSADGSVAYTTILSSSSDDYGYAIAVDAAGNAYVAGATGGGDFPTTPGAWRTVSGGNEDGFAAKLDANGNLVYASYIGGTNDDSASSIAVDAAGNAYIAGSTASPDFPTSAGAAQRVYADGGDDAFAVKLSSSGATAIYATLLGGSGNDQASSVALDSFGDACIAGYTDSPDLPVRSAVQTSPGGQGDAMVACLNAAGTAWTMVSYLGGSGGDAANTVAIDGAGSLYVAGTSFSWDFPVTPGVYQAAPAGEYDAFVVKLNPGAGTLVYATLLGGSATDVATALATGGAGDIWAAGYTRSNDFPAMPGWQSSNAGGSDGFLAHLSADGSTLLASGYLGGSQDDEIWGIATGPEGQMLIAGSTASTGFSAVPVPAGTTSTGDENAFLTSLNPSVTAFSISGQITVAGVAPLSGSRVTLSGSVTGSRTTDASGKYSFGGLPAGGNYTVTPDAATYDFSPSSQTFDNLSADQTAGFTASCPLNVTPAAVYLDSAGQPGPPLFVTGPAGCLWVSAASADFIRITSGTNGMGTGAITFSVPVNDTGSGLSGLVQVDGQAVSITQRATSTTFSDVDASGFYFDGANILYAKGITGGCSSAPLRYCPNDNITRGQMAVFLVAAVEANNQFHYTSKPYFTDVPATHPFFRFIQKLKDLGITGGCSASRFCPDAPVTRGQMAVFIIAARYGAVPYTYSPSPYFRDVTPSNPFFRFIQKMDQAGITAGCGAGLYCPDATLTRGQMAVFIAAGLLNELPGSTPVVKTAAPDGISPGEAGTVTLSASGTHFAQGATQVWMAPGITPSNIAVTSSGSLSFQVDVSPAAAVGPSSVVVTTGTEEAVLPNGFQVR